jgi:hypothetical protein
MPWAPSYTNTPLSKARRNSCLEALALVGQNLPDTLSPLSAAVPQLDELTKATWFHAWKMGSHCVRQGTPRLYYPLKNPKHGAVSPKKRKNRAVSGATIIRHDSPQTRDTELKRRKLEESPNPDMPKDVRYARDLSRLAHYQGHPQPDPSASNNVMKDEAETLRIWLKCINNAPCVGETCRNCAHGLSDSVSEAAGSAKGRSDVDMELSELRQTTKELDGLNDMAEKVLREESNANVFSNTRDELDRAAAAFDERSNMAGRVTSGKWPKARPVTPPRSVVGFDEPNLTGLWTLPREVVEWDCSDTSSDNLWAPLALPKKDRPTELSQEEIQRNYAEFEEQAQRKAAGEAPSSATNGPSRKDSVATTDTVGDMDFERIFLGDSDEDGSWLASDVISNDVDGLSEDMEGLEMEGCEDGMGARDGVTVDEWLGRRIEML